MGEVIAYPSAARLGKIDFCLLDVNDFIRFERKKNRPGFKLSQDMLNWYSWLRMHHLDPQWAQHVITNDSSSIINFSKLKNIRSLVDFARVEILNAINILPKIVADLISNWINICISR